MFGYPGAAVIPIYENLEKPNTAYFVRHEQGAGHSASGYARATGNVSLLSYFRSRATIITAVATAYMDSIPMVILTGQVTPIK